MGLRIWELVSHVVCFCGFPSVVCVSLLTCVLLSSENDWGTAGVNITQVGTFEKAPYKYKLTPLPLVAPIIKLGAGVGKI